MAEVPQDPLEGRDPRKHQYHRLREWRLAIFGSRAPQHFGLNALWTARIVWEHPQGVLRSVRDRHHSPCRGRFALSRTMSQGPGCSCRNVVGAGGTVILVVEIMVNHAGPKKKDLL